MNTLLIFAREPAPGCTKTRLCPPLDGATAAALYACFLSDVLALARRVPGVRPVVAYSPATAGPFFAALAPDLLAWPQRGAGLGERMDRAFRDALAPTTPSTPLRAGDRRLPTTGDGGWRMEDGGSRLLNSQFSILNSVVIIGSDSPDLPTDYVWEAFARLDGGADVVLGPAEDGGYYLIGLCAPQPRLLREVPMSTPTVLADTLALARELGLRVELLPPWYDVDTSAELRWLAEGLRDAPPEVAPCTRAFLASLNVC